MNDPVLSRMYAAATLALALLIGVLAVAWAPHIEPLWAWVRGDR